MAPFGLRVEGRLGLFEVMTHEVTTWQQLTRYRTRGPTRWMQSCASGPDRRSSRRKSRITTAPTWAYNHAANIANGLKLSEEQKLGIAPFPGRPNSTVVTVGADDELRQQLQAAMQQMAAGDQQGLKDQIEELRKEIAEAKKDAAPATKQDPATAPLASDDAKKTSWLPTILGAMGGAGTVGTGLLLLNSLLPQQIPATDNQPQPPVVTDPHYDPSVGLEVEGLTQ